MFGDSGFIHEVRCGNRSALSESWKVFVHLNDLRLVTAVVKEESIMQVHLKKRAKKCKSQTLKI
jgi:hypothetical protein